MGAMPAILRCNLADSQHAVKSYHRRSTNQFDYPYKPRLGLVITHFEILIRCAGEIFRAKKT